jgi:predicted signal transduction protein with EAL and GGDEF domain
LGVDSAERAGNVAQKLMKSMEQPFVIDGHVLHMRMSAGIALYPEHGTDPMTLLQQADMAMYYAKQRRSGFALSDSTRHAEWLARMALERDLYQALQNYITNRK